MAAPSLEALQASGILVQQIRPPIQCLLGRRLLRRHQKHAARIDLESGRLVNGCASLTRLYGHFRLPQAGSLPYIFSNFVSTLDGVASLRMRGHANGGDISGFNAQDRMVMSLLRAVADVVIVGLGDAGRR